MDKIFCPNCNKKVNFKFITEFIKTFRGVEVNVSQNVPVCLICEEHIYLPEFEEENFNMLYNKYRELANYIYPIDIVNFRNKYKISQREFGSILEWGKMTINRYENGSLPSKAHNDYLKAIFENEGIFFNKVKEAYANKKITFKTFDKIQYRVSDNDITLERQIIENLLNSKPSIFNGFTSFDLDKLEDLISYIASKVNNLTRTTINKYLWFIDCLYFKDNVLSITGLKYIKGQFGPVIEKKGYEKILALTTDKFYPEIEINGYCEYEIIKSDCDCDLSLFENNEIEVIDKVIDILKDKNVTEISDLSHKERAWVETDYNEYISYEYSNDLILS